MPAILLEEHDQSPPPPVQLTMVGASAGQVDADPGMSPVTIQLLATGSVCVFLGIAFLAIRWYLHRLLHPTPTLPASDFSSILVAFDWGADKAQSIKVPLDGLKTAAELISSVVDYGAEEVDPEMSVENVQVVYVDKNGKTKPVGSKTALSLLKKARKVRISPVGVPLRKAPVEKASMFGGKERKTKPKKATKTQRGHRQLRQESDSDQDDESNDEDRSTLGFE
eukprot:Transcript_18192.p1 GENE.Transcript_18192~~Transcript_18192.p1  ORF type:complete len:255 (+),score=46.24 Transcript_18192:95-766(+)